MGREHLTHAGVARYLVEAGLLSARSIVDGDLVVRDASRRNQNFLVERRRGASYVVKQGNGPGGPAAIAREAAVYEELGRHDELRSLAPAMCRHDTDTATIVLEYLPGSHDVRSQGASAAFAADLAAAVGRALAILHSASPAVAGAKAAHPPGILSIHEPGVGQLRELSGAAIALVEIVQRTPGFSSLLDQVAGEWQVTTFIHGDLRWDNVVVVPAGGADDARVLFVDWELARIGDPAWDVGTLFAQYLSDWLVSIPITGRTPPARLPALARRPLESMQPAMEALWRGYAAGSDLRSGKAEEVLRRAVLFAGACLVQTAFEMAQEDAVLSALPALHLQLALNSLRRPRRAAALLGVTASPMLA
jgi:aminoglycoside phosphotransferase (APT) family kinase protein